MQNNLYINILRWAYDKRFGGFTENELFQKFGISTDELKKWYLHVFRGAKDNEECLIGLINDGKGSFYCSLTARGLSAAVDYLNLEEAKKSSKRAEIIALIAIAIGIITSIVEIITRIYFK